MQKQQEILVTESFLVVTRHRYRSFHLKRKSCAKAVSKAGGNDVGGKLIKDIIETLKKRSLQPEHLGEDFEMVLRYDRWLTTTSSSKEKNSDYFGTQAPSKYAKQKFIISSYDGTTSI